MIKSYPKILPLVGKYFDLIAGVEVEVTEKVDGSMFAFGKDHEGNLHFRSKGAIIEASAPQDLFKPAIEYVITIQHELPNGVVYYGETLKSNRHNTLNYNSIPKNHIALFGMFDFDRTAGNSWEVLKEEAARLNLDVVPLLGKVPLGALNEVEKFLELESYLGGPKIEGVVLKDYTRPMEFAGQMYPLTALKFVSDAVKEKHADNPEYVPQSSKLEVVIGNYRTEARWDKAIQHLKEQGLLVGEPKDIGLLMKELSQDLIAEEKENFKEELYQIFKKQWTASLLRGFPEYYKRKLLES